MTDTSDVNKPDRSFFTRIADSSGDLLEGVVKAWAKTIGAVGGALNEWSTDFVKQIDDRNKPDSGG